jgi:hypothetical protein
MRVEELYERGQRRTLTMAEASEILGITERTFRRWISALPMYFLSVRLFIKIPGKVLEILRQSAACKMYTGLCKQGLQALI